MPTITAENPSSQMRRSKSLGMAFFWLSGFYFVYCIRPEDWIHPLGVVPLAKITGIGALLAFLLGSSQLIFAWNFFYSLVAGPKAGPNPWHANSLEWATTSPPPHYNYERIPTVYHAPYEYSVPGVADDFLPQTLPRPAEAGPLDPVMA